MNLLENYLNKMEKILKVQTDEIQYLINNDLVLRNIVFSLGDLEYEVIENEYKFLIFTIIGQMLSNKVGNVLYDRFEKLCNYDIQPKIVKDIGINNIKDIGISSRKANAIICLTNELIKNNSYFNELRTKSDEEVINHLSKIDGIGAWTAKMILLFCFERSNVLPLEDGAFVAAFKQAYGFIDDTRDKRHIKEYCKRWEPFSSYAARYLYRAYDLGIIH